VDSYYLEGVVDFKAKKKHSNLKIKHGGDASQEHGGPLVDIVSAGRRRDGSS